MDKGKKKYYTFILGSLAISLLIQFLLPFPFGLIIALIFYISLPQIVKHLLKIKSGSTMQGFRELDKTCLTCGLKTKRDPCPRCGKRQFGFR